jgi:hypothetical protein
MAAEPKPVSLDECRHALDMLIGDGITYSEGETTQGKVRFLLSPGDIFVSIENDKLRCQDVKILSKLSEIILGLRMDAGQPEEKMPTCESCPPTEEEECELSNPEVLIYKQHGGNNFYGLLQ